MQGGPLQAQAGGRAGWAWLLACATKLPKILLIAQRLLVADVQAQPHRVHQVGLHHADVLRRGPDAWSGAGRVGVGPLGGPAKHMQSSSSARRPPRPPRPPRRDSLCTPFMRRDAHPRVFLWAPGPPGAPPPAPSPLPAETYHSRVTGCSPPGLPC